MAATLDHIAILVESIDAVIPKIKELGLTCGPVDEFPSEGTREMYVGNDGSGGRLLLMQAIGEGPYKSALERRGPGLHHIAFKVEDLNRYIDSLSSSGWYLHPRSLQTIKDLQTAWLVRPGVPTLIEVIAGQNVKKPEEFVVSKVELPARVDPKLVDALGVANLGRSSDNKSWLTIGANRYEPMHFAANRGERL